MRFQNSPDFDVIYHILRHFTACQSILIYTQIKSTKNVKRELNMHSWNIKIIWAFLGFFYKKIWFFFSNLSGNTETKAKKAKIK